MAKMYLVINCPNVPDFQNDLAPLKVKYVKI